jgi:hypothetical protein
VEDGASSIELGDWQVSSSMTEVGWFWTGGSSLIVIMGMEEGKGVVVRVRGGREDKGMAYVIMESTVDLDGE